MLIAISHDLVEGIKSIGDQIHKLNKLLFPNQIDAPSIRRYL